MIKSKYDNRIYKTKILKNKLEVMIIYDKDLTRSTASMNVGFGCFNEPINVSGLAHFVEHMIFMGTKKYPDENEFSEFLNNNGGTSNAYTGGDVINYYFEINSIKFFEALDMFAQFFIDPLFKKKSIDKEMNAVNAEHSKNIQNDDWRINRLIQKLSNKKHIINKFCTGSLETLNIKNIHKYVIELFNKYYSSNIMKLVILHNKPIDFNNKYIQEFGKIKNLDVNIKVSNMNPYDKNYIVYVKPILTYDKLNLYWSINGKNNEYFESTMLYIQFFFNNKDDKSLYKLLIDKKYILTMNIELDFFNNITYYLFNISLYLTKEGLKNISNIISIIHSYIKYLDTLDKNKLKKLYDKFNTINKLNFMFKEKEDSQDYVVKISSNMNRYKEKYYLMGNTLRKFDFKLIKNILKKLKQTQTITLISSNDIYNKSKSKMNKEKYYGIQYKISDKKIIIKNKKLDNIKLLNVNKFIPTKLNIKKLDSKKKYPIQLSKNKLYELWFKQDYKFKKPFIYLNIDIQNPIITSTSKNFVLNILFTNIINDFIYKKLNEAYFINYNFNIDYTLKGIQIKIEGYDDKFYYFIKNIFKYIFDNKLYKKYFNKQFELLKLHYKNIDYNSPLEQAFMHLKEIIVENYITLNQQKKEIKNIIVNDLLDYKKYFLSNMYLKYIFQGNIKKKEIKKYLDIIKYNKITYKPQINIKKLDNKRYIYLTNSTNINENDSAIISFYQIGKNNLRDHTIVKLLYLIMNESFFNELRTNQQLGYIVKNVPYLYSKTLNITFYIQSANKDPNYLLNKIDIFLHNFIKKLDKIDLKTYKVSLKEELSEKFINLSEEFNFNINEIYYDEYKFNKKKLLYKLVDKISKKEIIEFYKKYLVNGKNLVIQVCGKNCCSMTKLDKKFNKNVEKII